MRSAPRAILDRPRLAASVPAAVALGTFGAARAQVVPRRAGVVRIRVLAGRRVVGTARRAGAAAVRLPSARARALRVVVETRPRPGYAAVRRTLTAHVVQPALRLGSRGPSVLALERRLRELRYALRGVDAVYGHDTFEAVLAFQKVHRLARTGRVEGSLWRRLAVARVPRPRQRGGDHLEVDKTRNVLYEIVGGRVHRIVHVSTGATGNTPVGTFRVYRKVVGWDWVLWYPLYFLRGFAVHGYPSVPAYPASHGCVRVPMWIAPSLFSRHDYGTRIVVYT
jgi:N-acetylmuramoyl-L-alanine amidase